MKGLYIFDFGDPDQLNEYNEPILSEFAVNNQSALLSKRLPELTPLDLFATEKDGGMMGHPSNNVRIRLTDFSEAYKLSSNMILHQIYYLRQFQNLFDLELFANKLPSLAHSIAGLE